MYFKNSIFSKITFFIAHIIKIIIPWNKNVRFFVKMVWLGIQRKVLTIWNIMQMFIAESEIDENSYSISSLR